MTNVALHTKGYLLAGILFMISLSCAGLLYDLYWLPFIGFALLAAVWLITRPEMLLYVLIASIPWSIEYIAPPIATDLPDEPLMLLTSVSILFLLIAKRKELRAKKIFSVLLLLVFLQLLWSGFSALASTDRIVSGKFVLAKCWYLAAFLIAPAILFSNKKILINAAVILTVSMMTLTCFVIYKHGQKGFTFSGINPSLAPFFRNHVNYSALLACMIPLLIAFHSSTSDRIKKRWIMFVILIALVAVYFAYARGAWLAVVVSLVSWWLLKKRWLLKGYILSLLIVFASIAWLIHKNNYLRFAHDYRTTIFHENFREHLTATYQFKDVSTAERFYRWIAGMRMVKDNWQAGFGPNTFPDNYKYYSVPAFKTWVSANTDRSTVHNYFLTMTIEQGIIGLLLLLVLLGYAFCLAQKIYHRSTDPFVRTTARTCAMLLCMLCTVNFLSDLVETDKLGSIFYLTLGTLVVLEMKRQQPVDKLTS